MHRAGSRKPAPITTVSKARCAQRSILGVAHIDNGPDRHGPLQSRIPTKQYTFYSLLIHYLFHISIFLVILLGNLTYFLSFLLHSFSRLFQVISSFTSGTSIYLSISKSIKNLCLEWNNSSRKGNSCRADLSRRNEQFASITKKRKLFYKQKPRSEQNEQKWSRGILDNSQCREMKYMKHLWMAESEREKFQKEKADSVAAEKCSSEIWNRRCREQN